MLTLSQKETAVAVYKIYKNFAEAVRRLYAIGITISESGLRGIVRRLKVTGSVQDRRRSGRPRATRRDEDTYLRRTARRCRTKTLAELAQALKDRSGAHVSTFTISRRLAEVGLKRRVALKRPLLTHPQKARRLDFATRYRNSRITFWSKVIFTDEKIFQAGYGTAHVRVTRRKDEKYHSSCIVQNPKRGLQLHVWGALKWDGPGPLRLIKGNLNALRYQALIHDIQNICRGGLLFPTKKYIYQQDNAPAHSARSTLNFFRERKISFLSWPGNSPDLNIIEHAWSYVSRRIRSRGLPKNK